MQSVEPVLENAIKTLQKVVDVRGMGKKLLMLSDDVKGDDEKDDGPVKEVDSEAAKEKAAAEDP